MTVVSVQKYGFSTIDLLIADLDTEITKAHTVGGGTVTYFTKVFPTGGGANFAGATYPDNAVVIYETTTAVNGLANYMPTLTKVGTAYANCHWRFGWVRHDDKAFTAHAGTALTLPDDGEILFMTNRAPNTAGLQYREPPGCMNPEYWSGTGAFFGAPPVAGKTYPQPDVDKAGELFISRKSSIGAEESYPMNYILTMSNRGIVVAIWEDNQEEVPTEAVPNAGYTDLEDIYGNSPIRWFVIQRAVDRETGWVRGGFNMRGNGIARMHTGALTGNDKGWDPYVDGLPEPSRSPVFCVFGTGQPNTYKRFIVRENDVLVPGPKKNAVANTTDSPAIINPYQQQSITENGEFVVTFINNLSTSRFRYGDELDMLGTVGAEVMGGGTSITVRVYGETADRKYTAVYGNRPYGNGMRIMVLTASAEANETRSR